MKLIGIMPVRNEDWVLGLSLRAALMWCDEVVVLNHASTDRTWETVSEVAGESGGHQRLSYSFIPADTWTEMAHRQHLLGEARSRGATHIAMIDADEVLSGNLLPTIRETIEAGMPGVVLQLPWLALPRRTDRYLTSGVWGPGQQVSMAFKDTPAAHWALHGGRDFHHRNPMGIGKSFRTPLKPEWGGLMHLQFLSERRLRAKQQLYIQTELERWPAPCMLEGVYCKTRGELVERLNWMYGRAVYESDPEKHSSAATPISWWKPYEKLSDMYLYIDAEPWQEKVVHENIERLGRDFFDGVDSFGLY